MIVDITEMGMMVVDITEVRMVVDITEIGMMVDIIEIEMMVDITEIEMMVGRHHRNRDGWQTSQKQGGGGRLSWKEKEENRKYQKILEDITEVERVLLDITVSDRVFVNITKLKEKSGKHNKINKKKDRLHLSECLYIFAFSGHTLLTVVNSL